ncbi:histone deacetylase complex subunit SAP130-like isoform X2 [Copidosoma floridanum]|uniref:histone deacetylase complex subunit SAP130-like isoform X2 n=1 Tax=Copidosoma floridanum TaxID=29053 RepID=UPI0006C95D15|nr:histone deacetylase complex subunit SAP130-like isoform X2 [Copidosoma floridanum]
MSANNSSADNNSGKEKSVSEATTTVQQTVAQNLTTIQNLQTVPNIQNIQNVQNAVSGSMQSIQTAQTVAGQTASLVGKSISLDLNSSKLLMKPAIASNIVTSENSKIVNTAFCPGSTVKIITQNTILNTIERQIQSQVQQGTQSTQQIVTGIPSTYHVPIGPAAVANIANPRSKVATPLVRTLNSGQQLPISRPGNSSTCGKPRAPVGVANIPISRASDASPHNSAADFAKTVTIYKSRVNPATTATTQWQTKASSVVYTQTQRPSVPVVSRPVGRPGTATIFTSQSQQQQQQQPQTQQPQQQLQQQQTQSQSQQSSSQQTPTSQPQPLSQQQQQSQPRLVNPNSLSAIRPMQTTVLASTSTRLIAPIIQAPNAISRLPIPTRPPTPQIVMNMPQATQAMNRPVPQIQPNPTSRPLASAPINRVSVTTPVIGAPNRVVAVTSVQTSIGRQLTINTIAGASPGSVGRIVIPQQALATSKIQIQQPQSTPQQQQQPQAGTTRVVQAVAPIANFSSVGRVITTTSTNATVAANVTRVAQTGPTSIARITGMSLHPLPASLTPGRTVTPLKVTTQTSGIQTVQLKQIPPMIQPQTLQPQQPQQQTPQLQSQPQPQLQPQQQQQQQPPQPQPQPQLVQQSGAALQRAIGAAINSANALSTAVSTASIVTSQPQPSQLQGQYLHPSPHSTTYYSIDASGNYSQFRPTSMPPVRLLVDQGFDEPLGKPNASPRPSILRKRDVDSSPGKNIAKNLVPVLAALSASSTTSPPSSPKIDRDGGNHSSGSTTVSATSSPGLDEEPEQSRIPMNTTVEMSPRKKPRKQQLTGVELTEARCTDEDMQFITEEKIKKENIDENVRDKYSDKKSSQSQQENKPQQTPPVKSKPSLSMIGNSWKNQYGGRLHHYKRPSDVKPRDDKKLSLTEIAQQKQVLQKINGWKLHHLKTQLEDLSDAEKSAYKTVKATMTDTEHLRGRNDKDDAILDKINELCKGNMQRHNLVSEGLKESNDQLFTMLNKHKPHVRNLLQSNCNKRVQKKR